MAKEKAGLEKAAVWDVDTLCARRTQARAKLMAEQDASQWRIVVVMGARGQGKSSFVRNVLEELGYPGAAVVGCRRGMVKQAPGRGGDERGGARRQTRREDSVYPFGAGIALWGQLLAVPYRSCLPQLCLLGSPFSS
jgi:hypothetical protein